MSNRLIPKVKFLFVPVVPMSPMIVRRGPLKDPGIESLVFLQDLVGGLIEAIGLTDVTKQCREPWHAYLDEEGKLKGKPINRRATRLARNLGWSTGRLEDFDPLCGDVVFLGTGPEGYEADVPDYVLEIANFIEPVVTRS